VDVVTTDTRDWSVHPGEILKETLAEHKMTQTYLAWGTGYTKKHINQIVNGKASITAPMAVRLERELDVPARFWMNLQTSHDIHLARVALAAEAVT
jgi:HTH-type transcriptional regulator/antitoxin HigA